MHPMFVYRHMRHLPRPQHDTSPAYNRVELDRLFRPAQDRHPQLGRSTMQFAQLLAAGLLVAFASPVSADDRDRFRDRQREYEQRLREDQPRQEERAREEWRWQDERAREERRRYEERFREEENRRRESERDQRRHWGQH